MKFTDGQWMLQPGVSAFYPAEAHDVTTEGESLVIHAPTKPIKHRGDTLGGPLLTVTLSAPMDDVVRVRLEHFSGAKDRNPAIPLQPVAAPTVTIENEKTHASLRAGGLVAKLKRDGWEIVFEGGGRPLTKSGWRGLGYIQRAGQGNFVHEQAYKSVPFYMTNRGYGVLVNSTGPVSFEVASEKVARVQFSQPGESLEYFLIYGPTPKEILRKLTALTGRPALPPAWTFGLWLTTSFTTSYDEATCVSFIEGMKQRDLPLHVFHFDCFWMREFDWCNFQWDPRTFPDPEGMLKRVQVRGL
jgi:alpha-D-xyloside xylohydrolase